MTVPCKFPLREAAVHKNRTLVSDDFTIEASTQSGLWNLPQNPSSDNPEPTDISLVPDQAVDPVERPGVRASLPVPLPTDEFPEGFADAPVILPSLESNTRAGFDRMLAAAGVRPRVIAEVDDMAMLRLMAREGEGFALVPPVVVRDEIERGELVETHRVPELRETFYAITPSRKFPNPLVGELVERMGSGGKKTPVK
jgi:LysR family transcriptional activator of nhaA